jgi:gamma-glutamyltranspeptidase/glutathione hydrolase
MFFRVFQDTLRPTITGTRGMVASAHPLASGAGLRILEAGGNAFDAAVAVAAALNVAEPYMSGIGGIGYAMLYSARDDCIKVLDYVGKMPYRATIDAFSAEEEKDHGIRSCLVPGACGGWLALLGRYGTMTREEVFAPAIELADNGFALTAKNEFFISGSFDGLDATAKAQFLFDGQPLRQGMILKQPKLANSFRKVVAGGADVFYHGELAAAMADHSKQHSGLLTERDLSEYEPEWIESVKLASADRVAYAAVNDSPIDTILSKEYITQRRKLIGETAAIFEGVRYSSEPLPGVVRAGSIDDWTRECTTHFDVVDGEGNAVAITQTLGGAFGSGVVPGDTGFFLNNFMYWVDLDPASPNCVAPNRKAEMCLSPCQVWSGNRLGAVLGTPGGHGILQTTVQVLMYLEMGLSIQAAIEAPRFRLLDPGRAVAMEGRVPREIRAGLAALAHQIEELPDWTAGVGGFQGIVVHPSSGAFIGGADPRRDGYALGY